MPLPSTSIILRLVALARPVKLRSAVIPGWPAAGAAHVIEVTPTAASGTMAATRTVQDRRMTGSFALRPAGDRIHGAWRPHGPGRKTARTRLGLSSLHLAFNTIA